MVGGKRIGREKAKSYKGAGEKKGGEISAVNTQFHVCKQHLAPAALGAGDVLIAFTGHPASPHPSTGPTNKAKLRYNPWSGCCKGSACQRAPSPGGWSHLGSLSPGVQALWGLDAAPREDSWLRNLYPPQIKKSI